QASASQILSARAKRSNTSPQRKRGNRSRSRATAGLSSRAYPLREPPNGGGYYVTPPASVNAAFRRCHSIASNRRNGHVTRVQMSMRHSDDHNLQHHPARTNFFPKNRLPRRISVR